MASDDDSSHEWMFADPSGDDYDEMRSLDEDVVAAAVPPVPSPVSPAGQVQCFGVDEMVSGRRVRLSALVYALRRLMPVEICAVVWDMSEPVLPVWRIHGFSLGCMLDPGMRSICNIARPDTVALLQHLGSLRGQRPGAAGKGVLAVDYCDDVQPGLAAEVVRIVSLESSSLRGGPPYNAVLEPVATAIVTAVTQSLPDHKFPAASFKIMQKEDSDTEMSDAQSVGDECEEAAAGLFLPAAMPAAIPAAMPVAAVPAMPFPVFAAVPAAVPAVVHADPARMDTDAADTDPAGMDTDPDVHGVVAAPNYRALLVGPPPSPRQPVSPPRQRRRRGCGMWAPPDGAEV
eukprot:TRINITY_DN44231_c0_g1_i1.p1 TRINITY_DN44231_c0_g1~~TRINITY_DN44231_c0_g1_i1.p1  ORF type:complete len:345 (+),score=93.53 TRINITY_DN44231_c0_g1_i1:49-1083(+)